MIRLPSDPIRRAFVLAGAEYGFSNFDALRKAAVLTSSQTNRLFSVPPSQYRVADWMVFDRLATTAGRTRQQILDLFGSSVAGPKWTNGRPSRVPTPKRRRAKTVGPQRPARVTPVVRSEVRLGDTDTSGLSHVPSLPLNLRSGKSAGLVDLQCVLTISSKQLIELLRQVFDAPVKAETKPSEASGASGVELRVPRRRSTPAKRRFEAERRKSAALSRAVQERLANNPEMVRVRPELKDALVAVGRHLGFYHWSVKCGKERSYASSMLRKINDAEATNRVTYFTRKALRTLAKGAGLPEDTFLAPDSGLAAAAKLAATTPPTWFSETPANGRAPARAS